MSEAEPSFHFPGGGRVLFTTRAHGNLSSVGGEDAEHGLQARERLREQIGVSALVRGYQVHASTVSRVRTAPSSEPPQEELSPADGQATALHGVGAMVLTADCLPVALGCSGAVAMVHAGWRGLAAGVLEEGVRAVREVGGADEIIAIIGPGAGPCCYEVGEEVHAAFAESGWAGSQSDGTPPTRIPSTHTPPARTSSTRRIDLKAIARDKLLAAGVSEVHDVVACTICDERFFSYRREGARAGRQGTVAWLS